MPLSLLPAALLAALLPPPVSPAVPAPPTADIVIQIQAEPVFQHAILLFLPQPGYNPRTAIA